MRSSQAGSRRGGDADAAPVAAADDDPAAMLGSDWDELPSPAFAGATMVCVGAGDGLGVSGVGLEVWMAMFGAGELTGMIAARSASCCSVLGDGGRASGDTDRDARTGIAERRWRFLVRSGISESFPGS